MALPGNTAVATFTDGNLSDTAGAFKALVERLREQNRREAVQHRRIYRPWGYYQGVDAGGRYQVVHDTALRSSKERRCH